METMETIQSATADHPILTTAMAAIVLIFVAFRRQLVYYTKMMLFLGHVIMISSFGILFGILYGGPTPKVNEHLAKLYSLTAPWTFNITVDVKGRELMEKAAPCVIVCNHQSALDTMGMCKVWVKRTVVLGKRELAYVPLFGQYFILGGNVFIDRGNRSKALDAMAKVAERVKKDKLNVWIFPEGTRSSKPGMLPFKKGAFHLAVDAQIPIVPVVIAPQVQYLDPKNKHWGSGVMRLQVLPAVSTTGLARNDVNDLISRVRADMMKEYCAMAERQGDPLPELEPVEAKKSK